MNDHEIRDLAMLEDAIENRLRRIGEEIWAALYASIDATTPPVEPPAAFTPWKLNKEASK